MDIIKIKEEIELPGTDIVLEAGDHIKVLKESAAFELLKEMHETFSKIEMVFDAGFRGGGTGVKIGASQRVNTFEIQNRNVEENKNLVFFWASGYEISLYPESLESFTKQGSSWLLKYSNGFQFKLY